jgi:hypothetical protein
VGWDHPALSLIGTGQLSDVLEGAGFANAWESRFPFPLNYSVGDAQRVIVISAASVDHMVTVMDIAKGNLAWNSI